MQLSRPFSVVTPTLDGDALAVLAGADEEYTAPRVHQLIGSHSVEGVRRVLIRLSEQGIVLTRQAGNSVLYRLNRDHLAAGAVVTLSRLRIALIERLASTLSTWETPPIYATLFGSAVGRDMRPDSDIDVFLVRPADVDADDVGWRTQVFRLEAAATLWTGNDARVLEYAASDLVAGTADPVLDDVRREGIRLFGVLPTPERRRVGATPRTKNQPLSRTRAKRAPRQG
jgi:predicted nucleotidyltransferase